MTTAAPPATSAPAVTRSTDASASRPPAGPPSASPPAGGPPSPSLGRARLRDRRIRTKLAIILSLPLIAILALSGLTAASAYGAASEADQGRKLVALGGTAGELAGALQRERAAAALVFALDNSDASLADYEQRGKETDAVAARFRAAQQDTEPLSNLRAPLQRVNAQLTAVAKLRDQVSGDASTASSVVTFRYRAIVADLLSYRQSLTQLDVEASTANNLRANAALSQAVESLGLMQVAVVRALDGSDQLTQAAQQEIVGADASFTDSMQNFRELAPSSWQADLNAKVGGEQVLKAERLQGVVTRATPDSNPRQALGTDAVDWSAVVNARMVLFHNVEHGFDAELLADVTQQRDAQRRTIVLLGTTVLAALSVMVLIGWWVTRSMTGSLNRLRIGAEAVATDRLPRMVAQLDGGHDPAAIQRLIREAAEPIPIDGTDEIGQVAAAFNSVAAAAAQISGEQAALRATVSGILLSLSRRLQLRADRMMASLDGLERYEEDPDRLAKLFDLDHVATLIRRLIANLQVLSGSRSGQATGEAVPLPELLRAAGAEIEDYKRVDLGAVDAGLLVSRDAAVDLMHLLAELLDNATKFSPPTSMVTVDGRRVGDLLHIQIHDEGIGMRPESLESVRQRLANPHRMDQGATQQMGLPVVGRIAERYDIKIEYRSDFHQGTRVDVTIPAELFDVATAVRAVPQTVHRSATVELPVLSARRMAAADGLVPGPAAPPAPNSLFTPVGPSGPGGYAPLGPSPSAGRSEPAVLAPPRAPLPPGSGPQTAFQPTAPFPPPAPQRPTDPPSSPVIFNELSNDPRRTWFQTMSERDAGQQPGPGPLMPPEWQAASAAAEAAAVAEPTMVTANGLPVREPGRRLVPSLAGAIPQTRKPPRPLLRDADALRRQMSAFESGLGAAGRRTDRVSVEEPAP